MPDSSQRSADRREVEHRESLAGRSPRGSRDTTMLGDVPICVISPPSSEPNAIGIRNTEGDTPDRFANWKAIGIMIASAPIFLTKADRTVTDDDEKRKLRPHAR